VNCEIYQNWPMERLGICYCTRVWIMYILGWGVWTCLLLFWRIYRKML